MFQLPHQENWADWRIGKWEVTGVPGHGGDGGREQLNAAAAAGLASTLQRVEEVCSAQEHSNPTWTRLISL